MRYILLLLLPLQLFAQSTSIIFKNVHIIDVEKGRVIANQNVLVQGNKIKTISSKPVSAKNATIINGRGKYLIPGLWDMHVHIFRNALNKRNEYFFPLFIANGVTGVRDMWTKPSSMPYVIRWRKQVEEQPGTIPRIGAVGTLIDGVPADWPSSDTVTTAEGARIFVRTLKMSGIDFVKVYGKLSREAYLAIVEEAKKLDYPFAGHAPNSVTLEEVSNAGQKSIEHLGWNKLFIDLSGNTEKFGQIKDTAWTPKLRLELLKSFSEEKCSALATILAKNRTWLCPTSVVSRVSLLGDDASIKHDERLQYIPDDRRNDWFKFVERFNTTTRSTREVRFQKTLDMINIMYKKGVPLLAGTDLGNPFLYAGFSLHDELVYFVNAGLSPLAALQTATINPAIFLNKQKDLGTVEKGKLADLVLLDANPLTDINNIRKINAVVSNGKLLQRKDLDKMLEDAKARAKASD